MAEAHDTHGMIFQNLVDAGCDGNTTEQCMKCLSERNYAKMISLLSQHRKTLLDTYHRSQKQIDCLDYLIYKIKKEKISGGKKNEHEHQF